MSPAPPSSPEPWSSRWPSIWRSLPAPAPRSRRAPLPIRTPGSLHRELPAALVLTDVRDVLEAPLDWKAPQWERFSLGVAGVGVAALLDGTVRDAERRDHSPLADQVAKDFEPLGNAAAFGVLSAFYLGGLIADDPRAKAVGEDGLIASLIAGGIITPALKLASGRTRPRDATQTFEFKPFSGASSFPSGHTTEAFCRGLGDRGRVRLGVDQGDLLRHRHAGGLRPRPPPGPLPLRRHRRRAHRRRGGALGRSPPQRREAPPAHPSLPWPGRRRSPGWPSL